MKRYLTLASILAVSALLVFSAFVSADDEVVQTRPSFIDEDGDGVCDNSGRSLGRGQGWGKMYRTNFVDEDGDGICDNCVDEDGDGICDNCANGENFVDADGDGVCDNLADGKERRGERGQRSRGRSGK